MHGPIRLLLLLAAIVLSGCRPSAPEDPEPSVAAERRDARIAAGDVTLAATLYRPAGVDGDLPAVVLGHGSGPQTRQLHNFWTNTALQAGLAVLVYDKRGTGESTGTVAEWVVGDTPRIVADLASDMVYAVRWLHSQPGIRKDQIGLMGGSQAGWVMPLAAFHAPVVRFVVIGEGVPLPTGVEEAHSRALSALGRDDESEASLEEIMAADRIAAAGDNSAGYDPAPVLERLRIPLLWTFGLHDGVIPARQSIDRIERLRREGHRNHDLHIFMHGNHDFQDVRTGTPYDLAAVVRDWLARIGVTGRQAVPPSPGQEAR